jgi:hypothetical protein
MPRTVFRLRWALVILLLVPGSAAAQESPPAFSYATYFECDPGREQRADALMRQTFFPIFDRHVKDKHLVGWGWLAHNFGGHWRRSNFMVAPSLDAVIDAQSAVLQDMRARKKEFAELSSICPRHEDYIWRRVTSSRRAGDAPPPRRSAARLGIYFECDVARESRADTVVIQALGPIWSRQVKGDGLNGWGWHEHVIGGSYRRLLLLDGGTHKAVLRSLEAFLTESAKERPAEGNEFGQICHSHQDYLWDIQTPGFGRSSNDSLPRR